MFWSAHPGPDPDLHRSDKQDPDPHQGDADPQHWCLWKNLYLGKNGDTLQIDGEGPEDLHGGELVVEHQGEQRARTQQEFDPEWTMKSSVYLWFILSYLNV